MQAQWNMSASQLESVKAVFGNLGFKGPVADELRKAMIQEIAAPGMGFVGNNVASLIAQDTSGNLGRLFNLGVSGVRDNLSSQEINNNMGDTLQAFRRSQVGQRERLSQQAIAGNTEEVNYYHLCRIQMKLKALHKKTVTS